MQLVLPILLDMVEEMSSNLDAQKMQNMQNMQNIQNIEEFVQNFFVQPQQQQQPQQSAAASCSSTQGCHQKPSIRCGRGRPHCFCVRRQQCQRSKQENGDFKVTFDVKYFKPEEISVKVKGREITIEGKHDEREEDIGFISRNFTRRLILADEFDIDSVTTVMNAEGHMTLKAFKLQPAASETSERIIPIQRVAEENAEDRQQEKASEENFEVLGNDDVAKTPETS